MKNLITVVISPATGKSISGAGWSQLISFMKSRAEYAGKIVELVNPGTSQVCICGHTVPKKLSMRIPVEIR